MPTITYNHNGSNHVSSIRVDDLGIPSVSLTVEELANYLEEQRYDTQSAEQMLARGFVTAGKAEQDVDPMIFKALEWKRLNNHT